MSTHLRQNTREGRQAGCPLAAGRVRDWWPRRATPPPREGSAVGAARAATNREGEGSPWDRAGTVERQALAGGRKALATEGAVDASEVSGNLGCGGSASGTLAPKRHFPVSGSARHHRPRIDGDRIARTTASGAIDRPPTLRVGCADGVGMRTVSVTVGDGLRPPAGESPPKPPNSSTERLD